VKATAPEVARWGFFCRGCTGVHVKRPTLKGRQYTRRRVTTHETEHGPVELWEVKPNRVSLRTLPGLKAEALAVIEGEGIRTGPLLEEAPHGNLLRAEVIDQRQHPGDSITGLAARIYEHAAHADEYRRLGAIDRAMDTMAELGALVALFDVYRQVSSDRANAGAEGARNRGSEKAELVRQIAATLQNKDQREVVSIIIQRAAAKGVSIDDSYARRVLRKKRD
jgi:hypothetical protein